MDYNYLILQRELDEKIKNKNRNESLFSSIKNIPKYKTENTITTPFNYKDNISPNTYQQSLNNISQKQSLINNYQLVQTISMLLQTITPLEDLLHQIMKIFLHLLKTEI